MDTITQQLELAYMQYTVTIDMHAWAYWTILQPIAQQLSYMKQIVHCDNCYVRAYWTILQPMDTHTLISSTYTQQLYITFHLTMVTARITGVT